jgi:hypothetical protein
MTNLSIIIFETIHKSNLPHHPAPTSILTTIEVAAHRAARLLTRKDTRKVYDLAGSQNTKLLFVHHSRMLSHSSSNI